MHSLKELVLLFMQESTYDCVTVPDMADRGDSLATLGRDFRSMADDLDKLRLLYNAPRETGNELTMEDMPAIVAVLGVVAYRCWEAEGVVDRLRQDSKENNES